MTGQRKGELKNNNPTGPQFGPDWPGERCGAKCKRTGKPCQAPAMSNGRCRLHGGKSTGPKTPEGIRGIKEATTTHGLYAGPDGVLRERPGPYWRGHDRKWNQGIIREAFKVLGLGRYKAYDQPNRTNHLYQPRDKKGRFR